MSTVDILTPRAGTAAIYRVNPAAKLAAVFAATTILLHGRASGTTLWQFLLVNVADGSVELSITTLLGVLAIGLPTVALFVTDETTDPADGLTQVLRLPSRFVLGALRGLRLVGLFAEDGKSLELARRARGIAYSGRLRRFTGQAFALLVLSTRRGSKLATAMEARGFGSSIPRSWARESRFGRREWMLVALSIALAAVGTSVLTGHWNFLAGA